MPPDGDPPATVRWEDLGRVVHEPARLVILVQLAFVAEAGYVSIVEDFVGKVPRTRLALTPSGRTAYTRYRSRLARLLADHPPDARRHALTPTARAG